MASKGKTQGKAVAAPVAEHRDGAKFATVRAGTTDQPVSMMINLNCPVDIILDNVKRHLLKKIDALLQSLAHSAVQTTETAAPVDGELSNTKPENDQFGKLQDIKRHLTSQECVTDLSEIGGSSVNCKDVSSTEYLILFVFFRTII